MQPDDSAETSVRASDAEREQAVDRLKGAAAEGRLTLEELADRTEAAYGATVRGELERVVADLPAAPSPAAPAPTKTRRTFVGIMGGDSIRGPIRLADRCTIVNVMGGVDLDLSRATIEGGELTLRIFSLMGGSTIRVPPGVHVERSGFSLMGGDSVRPPDDPPPSPDAPVIRIRSFNLMGGTNVRPPRRRDRG
ncbi:MAG TPA: DUF1707 domain-containing protein [Thermoleophilaceae bacterium]|nr:DUF1707 domain-containing protein [Thermoleophilaceae bacterium]